jgi:hypothetical protein
LHFDPGMDHACRSATGVTLAGLVRSKWMFLSGRTDHANVDR